MKTRDQIKAELKEQNPSSDGLTSGDPIYEALLDKWTDAALAQQMATVTGWPSVQQFLDAFTDAELATIGSSDNAQVKGLLIRLNGWRDIVHADDERIQLGLGLLVQLGLLTAERKAEIMVSATNL